MNMLAPDRPLMVAETPYGKVMYLETDHPVSTCFRDYGEFSKGEAELFSQIVRPGMLVVEAGAHVGGHTLLFSRLVGDSGEVHAWECQRQMWQILVGNMALNMRRNVFCHLQALGEREGSLRVHWHDPRVQLNMAGWEWGHVKTNGEPVGMIRLDDSILRGRQVHFMKLDVEAMELRVLQGAEEIVRTSRPVMFMENDRPQTSRALIGWLLDREYRLFRHIAPFYRPDNYMGNPTNGHGNWHSINLLCIPQEKSIELPTIHETDRMYPVTDVNSFENDHPNG